MLRRITIALIALLTVNNSFGKNPPPQNTTPIAPGYKRIANGLDYKFIKDEPGNVLATENGYIEMHISTKIADSVMFDSYKLNEKKPIEAQITKQNFGLLMDGILLMSKGDKALFQAPLSVMFAGAPAPPFAKESDLVVYTVELFSIKSAAEKEKETNEKNAISMKKDEVAIAKYLKDNKIKEVPKRTASGLYYILSKNGTGARPTAGQNIKANYTGKLLDGTVFDSNTDPKFGHVDAFGFPVGQGRVIKGWDEGFQLLNKGAKATLLIPSSLAYGEREMPGSESNPKGIPANSVLVFDVELLDIEIPVDNSAAMATYLKENKLENKVQKTASGLYYMITKKGTGENAKAGKKVTANYSGKLTDGTAFDSNVDPKFGHVQPFSFNLGQGQVIKGWDEGFQLLNKGAKATLIIPSEMAYGERAMPGGESNPKGIPANSILIFDVELVEIN
ncbi:MAG: FKBP-type peptidyl-prolyl cis-trans isomerase [Chitinophagaceae bacterium]|nr:FKBP-type peptidyl-prolyl cis-trans isomerase [Chitinophagaceae bacterium]